MIKCIQLVQNSLSASIFEQNKAVGWWDNPRPDGVTIALIHSEISEAYDGWLTESGDEHLPQFSNYVVELADAAIRIYDFCGFKGWDIELAARVYGEEWDKTTHTGYQICDLHSLVSKALEGLRKNTMTQDGIETALYYLAGALIYIYDIGVDSGLPIPEAIAAKLAYNAQRADHKRENREKEGGKKF